MKKTHFILFIYGELSNNQDYANYINAIFETITEDTVKYVQDRTSSVCHFTSKESLEELTDFFNYIFDEKIYAFFLIEKPEKIGVRLSGDLSDHLLNLNQISTSKNDIRKQTPKMTDEIFLQWTLKQMEDLNLNDDFFDDELDFDEIKSIRTKYQQPLSVDDILDKVHEKGMVSLTPDEKRFLKNFSNNIL